MKTFIQAVHISPIISAADDGPDEMTCFPVGLHTLLINFPNKNVKNITETMISVFWELFRERMAKLAPLDLYANFSKRENLWIV